jgi:hypothetical protein
MDLIYQPAIHSRAGYYNWGKVEPDLHCHPFDRILQLVRRLILCRGRSMF